MKMIAVGKAVLPLNAVAVCALFCFLQVQHGTGNATIMSQRINYCGGEAYLVDQVLLPCGDISAVMGEIANIPSPCRNNVEGVLNKAGLSYFNALLLATGVQRPVFSSGVSTVDFGQVAPRQQHAWLAEHWAKGFPGPVDGLRTASCSCIDFIFG